MATRPTRATVLLPQLSTHMIQDEMVQPAGVFRLNDWRKGNEVILGRQVQIEGLAPVGRLGARYLQPG